MSLISVIIPAFNREKFIGRCLRSLLDQSLDRSNYNIIVINDGSDDKTEFALNLFKDEIKVINNDKNYGLPYSLNAGIKKSNSKYIVRVDSDDYVNRNFLEILYLFISNNPEYGAVSSDYYLVNDNESIIKRENFINNPIGCSIMFKRDLLIDIGLYDENFKVNEEKDFLYRFLKKYKVYNVQLPLYRYRMHDQNMTKNKELVNKFDKLLKNKINND